MTTQTFIFQGLLDTVSHFNALNYINQLIINIFDIILVYNQLSETVFYLLILVFLVS